MTVVIRRRVEGSILSWESALFSIPCVIVYVGDYSRASDAKFCMFSYFVLWCCG
jgi:hypothetical protein